MAEEDVDGGVVAKGSGGDSKGSDEWVAPEQDLKLVIGQIVESAADLPTMPRRTDGEVLPVASITELRLPSPKPFKGRPDMDYADLDSLEPLYIPKFLVRRWGEERFLRSPYYLTWREEAGRRERLSESDFRKRDVPGKKK